MKWRDAVETAVFIAVGAVAGVTLALLWLQAVPR